jgi:hypothetical protein
VTQALCGIMIPDPENAVPSQFSREFLLLSTSYVYYIS